MKPFAMLLTLLLASPSLAVETLFTRSCSHLRGNVVLASTGKYDLAVLKPDNTILATYPVAVQNYSTGVANTLAAKVGQAIRTSNYTCFSGDISGGTITADPLLVMHATEGLFAAAPYMTLTFGERRTGTITNVGTGKYRLTDETGTYDLVYQSNLFGELNKLDDAVTSGDPITLGGFPAWRGNIGAADIVNYFVVEDFVD